eukprot:scaffold1663_cov171-Amphora_coffeaeformis.AAC.21
MSVKVAFRDGEFDGRSHQHVFISSGACEAAREKRKYTSELTVRKHAVRFVRESPVRSPHTA